MRLEDLRKGSYVDYISVEGKKTRCMVVDININDRIATMRELGNQSEFYVNSKGKWDLVKDVQTTEVELRKFGFNFDVNKDVYMLPNKGAWIYKYNDDVIISRYNGNYDLIIRKDDAFYGCKAIHVPSVHLLQKAVKENYGIDLSYV